MGGLLYPDPDGAQSGSKIRIRFFNTCGSALLATILKLLLDWLDVRLLDAVVVGLVLDGCAGWEVEHPPEDVPDATGHRRIVGRPVPDGENVLLEPDQRNKCITINQ